MRRTTITILDENLWKWAKKRTIDLDLKNISQYLFELIKKDRDGEIQWLEERPKKLRKKS